MRRYKIGKYYVTRDRKGRFRNWVRIGKSLAIDRKRKAYYKPKKSGQGNTGDYKVNSLTRLKNLLG